jgi:receptor protein-tyrosine kinase
LRAERSGVSTVLSGEHRVGEAVVPRVSLGDNTIALLPAGPLPPRPGQLWASDRATAVFGELADIFDYVILDTPPLNDYSDAANIAALGDGAIMLARIRSTKATSLRRALNALKAANVHLIGTVATFEPVSAAVRRRHAKPRGHKDAGTRVDDAATTTAEETPQSAKDGVRSTVGTGGEGR